MTHKGFAGLALIIAVAAVVIAGGAGYAFYTKQKPAPAPAPEAAAPAPDDRVNVADLPKDLVNNKQVATVYWKIEPAEPTETVPQRTKVTLVFRGEPYEIGTFDGGCTELGARPGIDGKGLLSKEGELAAVQCWYAGAGDEIGIFRVPTGFLVRIGELGEMEDGEGMFRGNFVTKLELE